ncbi:hypothetical protein D3C76_02240 [compost metagenome]
MDAKIAKTKISMENVCDMIDVYATSLALEDIEYYIEKTKSVVLLYLKNRHPYKLGCKIEISYGIPSISCNIQQHIEIEKWIANNENKYVKKRFNERRNNINVEFFLMEDFERFVTEVLIAKNI